MSQRVDRPIRALVPLCALLAPIFGFAAGNISNFAEILCMFTCVALLMVAFRGSIWLISDNENS